MRVAAPCVGPFPLKRFPAKTQPYSRFRPKHSVPRRLLEWARRMQGLYNETRRFLPSRASPCLPAVYIMPSRGIRVPCAGRFTRTSVREPHRATPRRSPVALPLSSPRSHNPTITLTDDALAAVRCGRNGAYNYISLPFLSLLTLLLDGTVPFA
ncbi:hypothetical protein B0H14DRAFT_119578 [Mycena olivaceomarginata]|nr:hypothetical protein B0H14DRAFT_119578 [Mycena olivaceomarginata]